MILLTVSRVDTLAYKQQTNTYIHTFCFQSKIASLKCCDLMFLANFNIMLDLVLLHVKCSDLRTIDRAQTDSRFSEVDLDVIASALKQLS